jgi:phosphatidylinositol alpha-1,6-mannosyltransferase
VAHREVTVLAPAHPEAATFDVTAPYRVERAPGKVLLPTPAMAERIEAVARDCGAELVLLDPPLPLGLVSLRMSRPHATFVHGGVATQARPPGARRLLRAAMSRSRMVISAGRFSAGEVRRAMGAATPPIHIVNPGVDVGRFRVMDAEEKREVRTRLGLPADALMVLSLSRLVPRKGIPELAEAVARLAPARPELLLVVGGSGRDAARIEKTARAAGTPLRMLGRVPEEDLADLYGCADVFAMVCHDRWLGLEQEGFGIVFADAAAAGIPAVAGDSGGAAEAVVDGVTGAVVSRPRDPDAVAAALGPLLDDPDLRARQGVAARERAERELSWDVSASLLLEALESVGA